MLCDLGREEEALADYEQAIINRPDYAEGYINRAIVLKALGRIGEAREDYQRAISINPDLRGVMEI
ncbi:MAG: tetratricopeptide repeat protein [Haliscomenobacter sp.]|nr:tetratricopeptide repeat protein [Haliscomenobacter sp.]